MAEKALTEGQLAAKALVAKIATDRGCIPQEVYATMTPETRRIVEEAILRKDETYGPEILAYATLCAFLVFMSSPLSQTCPRLFHHQSRYLQGALVLCSWKNLLGCTCSKRRPLSILQHLSRQANIQMQRERFIQRKIRVYFEGKYTFKVI